MREDRGNSEADSISMAGAGGKLLRYSRSLPDSTTQQKANEPGSRLELSRTATEIHVQQFLLRLGELPDARHAANRAILQFIGSCKDVLRRWPALPRIGRPRSSPHSYRPVRGNPLRRPGRARARSSTMPTLVAATESNSGTERIIPAADHALERQCQRDKRARNGRSARAAVGLDHVAIEPYGSLA